MVDLAFRRDGLCVVHGVSGQRKQVDTVPFHRSLGIEAGSAAEDLRQQAHSAGLTLDAAHQHLDVVGQRPGDSVGETAIVVSGVRSSWLGVGR